MDLGLQGRAAIVTGGASGIGAAVALALAREGCDVAIVDRRPLDPEGEVARGLRAAGVRTVGVTADVRDGALAGRSVEEIESALGRLDILVCSAGITDDAMSWNMTEAQWDSVIGVNLTGCFHWNRAVALRLKERGWGRIVNVASINGLRGKRGQANYAASKGGVIALSKTLARELGRFGVTVNVIAPGMVRTAMTRDLPAPVIEAAVGETVVGRLAEPEDCAETVAFLCSERARHLTGQVVRVDGGQYL